MPEVLIATALAAILCAMAIPSLFTASDRSKTWAAARYLATRMAAARSYAVMHGGNVALRFEQDATGTTFQMFADEDSDGVRTRDIEDGIDAPVGGLVRLADLFPGVDIGVTPDVGTDPIRIGSSNLLSFTPIGTSTSGSIYLLGADDTQLAVRVLGATGRTRIERYVPESRQWVASF